MIFGVHPFFLIAAIGVVLALAALVTAWMVRSSAVKAAMVVLALVFLIPSGYLFSVFHPELVDGRFRTYKAFYGDIQIGMTRDEVFGALGRRYPKSGARKRPKVMEDTADRLGFFMNPEISREPNCEGIFLKLEKGRVKSKNYSPD